LPPLGHVGYVSPEWRKVYDGFWKVLFGLIALPVMIFYALCMILPWKYGDLEICHHVAATVIAIGAINGGMLVLGFIFGVIWFGPAFFALGASTWLAIRFTLHFTFWIVSICSLNCWQETHVSRVMGVVDIALTAIPTGNVPFKIKKRKGKKNENENENDDVVYPIGDSRILQTSTRSSEE
jgi:hypothetical protein